MKVALIKGEKMLIREVKRIKGTLLIGLNEDIISELLN
jgi:hypothetical protein